MAKFKNSFPTDAQGNPIPINKEIICKKIVLTNENEHSLTVPAEALSVRIKSFSEFELRSSSQIEGFICEDHEFGCCNIKTIYIKGFANQVVSVCWAIL